MKLSDTKKIEEKVEDLNKLKTAISDLEVHVGEFSIAAMGNRRPILGGRVRPEVNGAKWQAVKRILVETLEAELVEAQKWFTDRGITEFD